MTNLAAPAFPAPAPRRALLWFRSDLRLEDNPALAAAAGAEEAITVFVDETNAGLRPRGGASRWWLHFSLQALSDAVSARGGKLVILKGDSLVLIPALAARYGCDLVAWNRRYGKVERETDAAIKADLKASGIRAESFNGNLLYEPMEVRSQAGGPLRVFTPFWKACRALREPPTPLPAPERMPMPGSVPESLGIPQALGLTDLALLPTKPDWAGGLRATWQPGAAGAVRRVSEFLDGPMEGYAENRDRPDFQSTSMLAPHLAFGEISPRQIWHATEAAFLAGETTSNRRDVDKFFAEIGWREFAYHLLFHYPDLATANYQSRFDAFPWERNDAALLAWQQGQTGYPIVDAGMRELWQTGFMHNRVRMIVASFLIKHLMIDWRAGEAWFWDTLCDADPANNAASWQWVAGAGADAAPYFRIFNPFTQGEKFDPKGAYIRRYVPELAGLGDDLIHRPWEAPPQVLARAGITLGTTYPKPLVDHGFARERALAAFKSLSGD
ncbi:MAG: deoxyribodipyrimidine photolyase [Rhizobiales bacterium PAR1]|nr:MAG: deoxyribodipyrimidine photolyase [Rhizobiales bacterium PAR1]